MMGFKQVIQQFKSANMQDGSMRLTTLPLLMKQIVDDGLVLTDVDGKFYQNVAIELFGDGDKELIGYIADAISLLTQMIPLPKVVEKPVVANVAKRVEVVVQDEIVRVAHLVASMPSEEDEGDPYYMPPEEQIALRPEDCAPVQYDYDFCEAIGATHIKRPTK